MTQRTVGTPTDSRSHAKLTTNPLFRRTRTAQHHPSDFADAAAADYPTRARSPERSHPLHAARVLTREPSRERQGPRPRVARIVATAAHAQEPAQFTVAPIGAIEKVLDKAGWKASEVDLWEVNEAFACVAMFAMKDLGIPHEKINVHGGATALGHPIGASGTRILVTLVNALKQKGAKRGVASLCIGGGEATAVAVELV
jgi:acetyl-CoA C-acetyltransferase